MGDAQSLLLGLRNSFPQAVCNACCCQNTHHRLVRIPLIKGTTSPEVFPFPRSSPHTMINWCRIQRLGPLLKLGITLKGHFSSISPLGWVDDSNRWSELEFSLYPIPLPSLPSMGFPRALSNKSPLGKSSSVNSQFLIEKHISYKSYFGEYVTHIK